jgi:hypothetical protein
MVPAGHSGILYHRARCLNPDRIKVEIWEHEGSGASASVRPATLPPPPEENRDFRWPLLGPFRWSTPLAQVLNLAPKMIRPIPGSRTMTRRLCGLNLRVCMAERPTAWHRGAPDRVDGRKLPGASSLVEEILFFAA